MEKSELLDFIRNHDESEIIEYKENLNDAEAIGKYISALGNSALLVHNPKAFLIWGVMDGSKEIVGTAFNPYQDFTSGKNRTPLITFLESMIEPRISLKWENVESANKSIVILSIDVTKVNRPIKFHGKAFIRSGTSNKNLSEFPEKQRQLWRAFESSKFELEYAATDLKWSQITEILDLEFYAETLEIDNSEVLRRSLLADKVLVESGDHYNITNLGAYTLSKNLNIFPYLKRKTPRITKYNGDQNIDKATFDRQGSLGIAVSFRNVIRVIMGLLPYHEEYTNSIRRDVPSFPQIAIRELVANALVHQDFTINGSRPFIELYDSRIEISNPGTPLIDPARFLDYKPKSRNDELADLLGKLKIVESRGTGIDKSVAALEANNLPAMDISIQGSETTVVKLTKKKTFKEMTTDEKNQSIYWNACLRAVEGKQIDNKSLRERFRLDKNASTQVSKALSNAVEARLIKPYDPDTGRKFVKYIPFWLRDAQGH